MSTPLTPEQRRELLLALDAPMTDDEAVSLILELLQLVQELVKVASPENQLVMASTLIRATKMAEHVAKRLAIATVATRNGRVS